MEKPNKDIAGSAGSDDIRTTIDPQLLAHIEALRRTPERDPQAVQNGITRFESEMMNYLGPVQSNQRPVGNAFGRFKNNIKETYLMYTQRNRIGLAIVIVILAVLVLLISSTTATVSASRNALPGDALYRVKTGWEQTQARITADEFEKAQMYLRFAQQRLDEIDQLIDEGRFADIGLAVDEFEFHVQQAIESLGVLASSDPDRAQELTRQLSQALSRYAAILTAMLSKVPETALSPVNRAINTANQFLDGPSLQDGNSNENANDNSDEDNSNSNDNSVDDNMNGNDDSESVNSNSNDNDDDDSVNTNSNDNDDDGNSNTNSNDNDDDNDTNMNSNDNDNDDD